MAKQWPKRRFDRRDDIGEDLVRRVQRASSSRKALSRSLRGDREQVARQGDPPHPGLSQPNHRVNHRVNHPVTLQKRALARRTGQTSTQLPVCETNCGTNQTGVFSVFKRVCKLRSHDDLNSVYFGLFSVD